VDNLGPPGAQSTKFLTTAPNVCGVFSMELPACHPDPALRIFGRLLDFSKICAIVLYLMFSFYCGPQCYLALATGLELCGNIIRGRLTALEDT